MTSTETAAGLEVYQPGALTFRHTPEQLQAWVKQLDEVRRAVLQKGTDYDVIAGGRNQDVLFKPGAEKLLMIAGLGVHMCQIPTTIPGHDGLTYRCSVTRQQPGATWACGQCGETASVSIRAQCEGYAGYDEDRYFQPLAQRKAKAEADERRFAAADERAVKSWKWESITEDYKAPLNTLMKMAQKRALVGATLNALAASGLFTQDLLEDQEGTPAAAAPPPYDAWAHLEPFFKLITQEEAASLKAWRDAEGLAGRPLETPRKMTEPMVERTLVQIGVIIGRRGTGTAPAPSPAPAPQASAGPAAAPPGGGNTPEGVGEPTAASAQSNDDDEPIGSLDDDGDPFGPSNVEPPAPEPVEPGRAVHFHRKAGALGLDVPQHEAIVTVASEGRTAHAGELSAEEMGFAELLLTQIEGGAQQVDVIVGAAEDMRRAVQSQHVVEARARMAAKS
jgi:hypothetical protein